VLLHRKPGDQVRAGDVLFELRTDDGDRIEAARAVAEGAMVIADTPPVPPALVLERIA
jgi:thymidine phosphorylase